MHDNEAGFKATKVNPYFLMLYGHIMAAGKSYHSALGESGWLEPKTDLQDQDSWPFCSLLYASLRDPSRRPYDLPESGCRLPPPRDAATG